MQDRIARLVAAVESLDQEGARRVVAEAVSAAGPRAAADELVRPALERIGELWEGGALSLAHVYMASRLCERALEAHLADAAPGGAAPRLAIAVFEDQHALGKRLVLSSLRAAGHLVRDYGSGLGAGELVERVARDRIEVLLLSVLMLRSALRIRELVPLLRRAGLKTRVVVGGAPFRLDPQLAAEVGADAWGATAADALRIVAGLLGPHVAALPGAPPGLPGERLGQPPEVAR